MNLIEAIGSGKHFKRKCQDIWWHNYRVEDAEYGGFSKEDILAEDWEVEEQKIEITKEQLVKAVEHSIKCCLPSTRETFMDTICKELGFK